jgi:hypothetical protein
MPNLTTNVYNTDTRIDINSGSISNILSVNEIINLNILGVIAPNFNVPGGSIFIADKSFSTAPGVGLNKYGDGTLVLTKENDIRSMTHVYEGTLVISNSKCINNGGVLLSGDSPVTLRIENNSSDPFLSSISAFWSTSISYPPTVIFTTSSEPNITGVPYPLYYSGVPGFYGPTIIEEGLRFHVSWIDTAVEGIQVNGVLEFTDLVPLPPPSVTISYTISGFGIVAFYSLNTAVTISSTNTYSGGTEIAYGTVTAGSSLCFGTGPIYLSAGATLDLNNQFIANAIYSSGGTILNDSNYTGQIYYI